MDDLEKYEASVVKDGFILFRDSLNLIKQTDPNWYQRLIDPLGPSEQESLKDLFDRQDGQNNVWSRGAVKPETFGLMAFLQDIVA